MLMENFTLIVIIVITLIILLLLLSSLSRGRFTKTKFRDEFKTKSQMGSMKTPHMNKAQTYKEIARKQRLEESKLIEKKVNISVTKSVASTSKDYINKD